MSRVLIWKKIVPHGTEYDIYSNLDETKQLQYVMEFGGFNVGNRLWFQGIMSAIDTEENEYEFLTDDLTANIINSRFDFVILPMANIFNRIYRDGILGMANVISGINIPIYVIACGVQADSYDDLESLVLDIGKESKVFIDTVYKTGGEFAFRGNFTKAFFEKLGYYSGVVTGCPSMYQLGRDFNVIKRDDNINNPIFNGDLSVISHLLSEYPQSIFFDQDLFLQYSCNEIPRTDDLRYLMSFYINNGPEAARLLGDNRVRLFFRMHNWREYIKGLGANYSFGTRIHGNIMAILSGVPATVVATDSRTREMAEFFHIPHIVCKKSDKLSLETFAQCYRECDYTSFNNEYQYKFDTYEKFLADRKIVSNINIQNSFFGMSDSCSHFEIKNGSSYAELSQKFEQHPYFYKIGSILYESLAKIKRVVK